MVATMIGTLALAAMLDGQGAVYSRSYAVVEVENQVVTCVDFTGNEWAFEDETDDWMVGDIVSAVMWDAGTPDWIYDDEFVTVSYAGWVEGSWGMDADGNYVAWFD